MRYDVHARITTIITMTSFLDWFTAFSYKTRQACH